MNIKKAIVYGVMGYVGCKTVKVYTEVVFNVGKIAGYLDICNDMTKKQQESKNRRV